ncbi:zinc-binding alcohol dehydrogenase-like protein [Aureobasidium sp. EXF-10727]|nr:zinc-binding alcohol dehydrogenase-like protein [Aureobasidium sp. EXF-10727]
MRGIQVKEYVQGPQDLKVTDLPDPTPKPNQYLIAVHAAATNFFDLLQIRGKYQHQPPLPWVSGAEFSGVVLKAPQSLPGGKKPTFKEGDKVFGASQGAYATKVCATEEQLRPMPKGWSYFESAGLMVTAPTSYAGLVTRAGIKKGDWVLVHAAAGGVGLAAVQIAKAFGATVVATAGTQHKLDVAKSFGADHLVDYRQKDWPDKVKKLTPKGRGVDIVYDPVGLIAQSMKCTAWNGRLLVIGFAAGDIEKMATNRILLKNVSVMGLHWGAYATNEPEMIEVVWKGLFDLMDSGKFRGTCYTDKDFVGLETIPEALKALGARDTWGKVVVKVPQEGQSKFRTFLKRRVEEAATATSEMYASPLPMSSVNPPLPLHYLIHHFQTSMASQSNPQHALDDSQRRALQHRLLLEEQQRRIESRKMLEASYRAPICPYYSVLGHSDCWHCHQNGNVQSSTSTDNLLRSLARPQFQATPTSVKTVTPYLLSSASTVSTIPLNENQVHNQESYRQLIPAKSRVPDPAPTKAAAVAPPSLRPEPRPAPPLPWRELPVEKDFVSVCIPPTFTRFLYLPVEVRKRIYVYLVHNREYGLLMPKDMRAYHQAPITRVNRQIRNESIDLVYKVNAYDAKNRELIKHGLSFKDRVGDDRLKLVRNWAWYTAKRHLSINFFADGEGYSYQITYQGPQGNDEINAVAKERAHQVFNYLKKQGSITGFTSEHVGAISDIVLRITPKTKAKTDGESNK